MDFLLVPTLSEDISLLERLSNSIDYKIATKVVINNGKMGALEEWHNRHPDWIIVEKGVNLGVAASWNLAPKRWSAEQFLILNDDFEFQTGQLELICKEADKHPEAPTVHFTKTEGYNCFIWRKTAVDKIGLFDENLWPSYFEDYDYRLRMRLLGLRPHIIGLDDSEIKHGKPYSGGQRYRKFLDEADVLQRKYYIKKWGIVSDIPIAYQYPFNDPEKYVSYWALDKKNRSVLEKLWNDFMSVENPLRTDVCE